VQHLLRGLWITWTQFPSLSSDQKRDHVKRWSGELMGLINVKINTVGTLPPVPFVVVANHISWCDIFAINSVHPVSFVAKAELARWPLAGRLLKNVGTLFIDRSRRRDTGRMVAILAGHIRDGVPLAFFPEGRVSHGTGVHAFNASLLQPAIDAGSPVLPIAIQYSPLAHFTYVHRNFLQSLWAVLGAQNAQITLTFLPPQRGDDRRQLARSLEQAIRHQIAPEAAETAPETPPRRLA
jgi:1-acyl-sn-glycerol-3-phosphate acyltransferase